MLIPDKEKVKLVSTEKRKADDFEQIKDLKKVNIVETEFGLGGLKEKESGTQ